MIYTDNDRHLCCPLCGGAQVRVTSARPTEGCGHGNGAALGASCPTCQGNYEHVFTPTATGTRVTFVTFHQDLTDVERVRAMYLADPNADSSPHRERQSVAQAQSGTRVTPHSPTTSERPA